MFTFIPITFLESTVKVRQSHKKTAKNICEQKRDNRLNFLLGRIDPNWCSRVKEGQWEKSIDTVDPGSEQIAVEEGRDALAGLRDLVVVVVIKKSDI